MVYLQPIQEIPQDLVQRIKLLELTDGQKDALERKIHSAVELNHRGDYRESILAVSDLRINLMWQVKQGSLSIPVAAKVEEILDDMVFYPSLNGILHSYHLAESALVGLVEGTAENREIMDEYLESIHSCIDQAIYFAQSGKIDAQGAIQDLYDLLQLVREIQTQGNSNQSRRRYYN